MPACWPDSRAVTWQRTDSDPARAPTATWVRGTHISIEQGSRRADEDSVTQLIETRWTRYGKDRVYVKTPDGAEVGHVDLVARTVVAKLPGHEADLQHCLARWSGGAEPASDGAPDAAPTPAPAGPEMQTPKLAAPAPSSAADDTARDLAANVAGAAARNKRDEVNAQAPVMNMIARVLGVKTDERAWRVGAKGEEKVASELAKLGPAWRMLHAVEVGENGSDIDHVVIGPPGVFTLNAKRHPRGKAWVGERMVMVNGQRTDYLRNSRHEAQRAARLLSAAYSREVAVKAAIVFVDLDDFTVKQMPSDVHVTTRRRLLDWFRSLPASIDETEIDAIYTIARLSSTWK